MINLALIGIGRIGRIHAANLVSCRGARLRVICDARSEVAKNVAQEFGVDSFSSPQDRNQLASGSRRKCRS
jgi:predicted dehydrogenase